MATLHMVKGIFTTALDAALITLKAGFNDIKKNKISFLELENAVCAKFNSMIKDSGVRDNLFGKARTIDLALSGDLNSAIRNETWMKNVDTVNRLDEDVNQLRMLCSAKGLDKNTRVLNTCFSVTSVPGKSSSIIKCNKLFFDKVERGEITVDSELKAIDPQLIDEFDDAMLNVENAYNEMKSNYDQMRLELIEAEKKISDLTETNQLFFDQCSELQDKINKLEMQLRSVSNIDYKLLAEETTSFIVEIHEKIENLNTDVKNKCALQSKLFDLATVCENMNPLCVVNRFKMIMDELCDNLELVQGLASKCGFQMSYD